jgi:ATP/maltotriose-dependent transcriptional regulator MalT
LSDVRSGRCGKRRRRLWRTRPRPATGTRKTRRGCGWLHRFCSGPRLRTRPPPRIAELMDQPALSPAARSAMLSYLSLLRSMQGDIAEGRRLVAEAAAIAKEMGLSIQQAWAADFAGMIEALAGDHEAAEVRFRSAHTIYERMAERGYLSTVAAHLAESLWAQGKDDEALRFAGLSEALGVSDDVVNEMQWREVRAKVLARRGESDEGERLAREAVALGATTDMLDFRALAHLDLAQVLTLGGKDARPEFERALALYERKGNLVMAERVRAKLPPPPVAGT